MNFSPIYTGAKTKKKIYSIKRTPIKKKPYTIPKVSKKHKPINKQILKEVCIRDGGEWADNRATPPVKCKYCGEKSDMFGFEFAHKEHRKMGGRFGDKVDEINSMENIIYIPKKCHDRIDGRTAHSKEQIYYKKLHKITGK